MFLRFLCSLTFFFEKEGGNKLTNNTNTLNTHDSRKLHKIWCNFIFYRYRNWAVQYSFSKNRKVQNTNTLNKESNKKIHLSNFQYPSNQLSILVPFLCHFFLKSRSRFPVKAPTSVNRMRNVPFRLWQRAARPIIVRSYTVQLFHPFFRWLTAWRSRGGGRSDGWPRGGVRRTASSSSSGGSPAVVRGGFGAVVHREHSTSLYTRARVPTRPSRLRVASFFRDTWWFLSSTSSSRRKKIRLSFARASIFPWRQDLSVVSIHAD